MTRWLPFMLPAVLLAGGCGEKEPLPPPTDARSATLRLFRLAHETEPLREDLHRVFDRNRFDEDRVAAREAVLSLRKVSAPRVLAETVLPTLKRTVVDVSATLPGGGSAFYSFQVEEQTDGAWRVISILGPHADWPPRPRRSAPGLTVSAPPGKAGR